MLKNFFTPTPLTFGERRKLLQHIYARNGYIQRPAPSKQLINIADKLNSLMYYSII